MGALFAGVFWGVLEDGSVSFLWWFCCEGLLDLRCSGEIELFIADWFRHDLVEYEMLEQLRLKEVKAGKRESVSNL